MTSERRPSSRFGLGRGLGSLLPEGDAGANAERSSAVRDVEIEQIAPNPRQPRVAFDADALEELAASIRAHGVIQPLIVSRRAEDGDDQPGGYLLIAGERRLRAARLAGLARVPVVVRETTPRELLELALVENLQRADLNPLEEAAAYRQLIDEFGLTQEAVAERAGKSRAAVANALRLLALPEGLRASLLSGEISEGHARALLGLTDDDLRLQAWREVVNGSLSVRQTEELVRRLRDAASAEPAPEQSAPSRPPRPTDPQLADLEERLQRSFNTQVKLERSRTGGRIVIRFYGDEDLEALLARLLGETEG